MAARSTGFALVFWIALAGAVAILTITPWASAPDPGSKSTPIAARDTIYRPQHWNVY